MQEISRRFKFLDQSLFLSEHTLFSLKQKKIETDKNFKFEARLNFCISTMAKLVETKTKKIKTDKSFILKATITYPV